MKTPNPILFHNAVAPVISKLIETFREAGDNSPELSAVVGLCSAAQKLASEFDCPVDVRDLLVSFVDLFEESKQLFNPILLN